MPDPLKFVIAAALVIGLGPGLAAVLAVVTLVVPLASAVLEDAGHGG